MLSNYRNFSLFMVSLEIKSLRYSVFDIATCGVLCAPDIRHQVWAYQAEKTVNVDRDWLL